MKNLFKGQRGVSLITAIMLLLLLSVLGLAVVSLVMVESQISVNQLYSLQAFSLAEAGIERAIRAIRDDESTFQTTNPAAAGYCVTPSLDGYSATGSNGSNYEGTLFYGTSLTDNTAYYCTLYATVGTKEVQVYDFQQRYNLLGTPIIGMEIGIRAIKSAATGTDPIVQLGYSTDGGSNWTDVGIPITVSATAWGAPVFTTMSVPTWNDLMAAGGSNFRIRALRNNLIAGDRDLYIDYLCIRVMLKADSSTEPWFTTFKNSDGTPITTKNIALGNGVIESLPIDDEQGKVHLNYASQTLLQNLMIECGIPSIRASTLAASIVASRNFNSVEELLKPAVGMTTAEYNDSNHIKDYVTVYSWVNPNVQRPAGNRAPININTAPLQVLLAVFDPLVGLGATDPASLANAIIARRNGGSTDCGPPVPPNPFSSMISSNPADTSSSFARFVDTQTTYLTTAAERNAVKENCDASLYNITNNPLASWTNGNVTTTEFCYSSNVYSVTARGKVENSYRQVKRVFTDTGKFDVPIPSWGTTLNYWREIVP